MAWSDWLIGKRNACLEPLLLHNGKPIDSYFDGTVNLRAVSFPDALRLGDPRMIIAHGPTIHESGSIPYRIVLRELDSKYVVHTECMMPDGNPSYCWGDYFQFTNESSKATMLLKAWDRFVERTRATL